MATYSEKDREEARYIENAASPSATGSDMEKKSELMTLDKPGVNLDELIIDLSEKEKKRILRKVDMRLVPLLTLLYLIAFIDRSNSEFGFQYFYELPLTSAQLEMPRLQAWAMTWIW